MIAVVAKKVIRGALEFLGGFFDDVLDFLLRPDGEAVKKLTSKGPSWWFHSRPSPVHPLIPGRSWPPYAYSLSLMMTPECKREPQEPIA
jgi:hypothetical protein